MDYVHKIPYKQMLPVIIGSAGLYCVSPGANADVTFDGSLGTAGTLNGSTMDITADRGQIPGNNLFHSFSKFNVNTEQTVNFSGPDNIQNIFGRVTGSERSRIDGIISSSIPGVNLFLMNPNGMLFGPNAQINISGSFHATTADYISFGNQQRFYADSDRTVALSVAAPSAFGFLDDTVAGISIDGSNLTNEVDGKSLTITAGNIEITNESNVSAPDGLINIASVQSKGEVATDLLQTPWNEFTELGSININNGSTVSASGASGGRVVIRGGQLVVDSSSVSADTEVFAMQTEANIDIELRDSVTVDNGGKISADLKMFADGTPSGVQITTGNLAVTNNSSIQAETELLSFGNAGNITVNAQHILLDNYSQISTSTFSTGDSGNIVIENTDTLDIKNASSINSSADWLFGEGKSGDISISTNNLHIVGLESPFDIAITDFTGIKAGLSIINGNDAGNVTIIANNTLLDQNAAISTWTSGGYKSGDINIQSQNLHIEGGSYLQTYSSDNGHAGAINITSEEIVVSGVSPNPDALFDEYNFSRIVRIGGGESNISLNSQNIYVLDGGKILSESSVSSFSSGNIQMHSDLIVISGVNQQAYEHLLNSENNEPTALLAAQSLISSSLYAETYYEYEPLGVDNAGSIYIESNNFALEDGAAIRANADGFESSEFLTFKEGGNIEILINEGRISDSTVSATSFAANGGNIRLVATESLLLQNSNIKASAQSAAGNGGNIDIKSGFLLLDGNSITATAYAGAGGNIELYATSMLILENNIIDASSELSVDGVIQIDSELDLNNSLEKLPDSKIDPASQFTQNCQFEHFEHNKSILTSNVNSQPIVAYSYTLPSIYDYKLATNDTAISQPISTENNLYVTMLIDSKINRCAP